MAKINLRNKKKFIQCLYMYVKYPMSIFGKNESAFEEGKMNAYARAEVVDPLRESNEHMRTHSHTVSRMHKGEFYI